VVEEIMVLPTFQKLQEGKKQYISSELLLLLDVKKNKNTSNKLETNKQAQLKKRE
jgi:hypothetical protein